MYWPATKFVPFYLLDADVSVHHHANLVDIKYFELYQFVVSLLDLLISANFLVSILVHWNLDKLDVSSWD